MTQKVTLPHGGSMPSSLARAFPIMIFASASTGLVQSWLGPCFTPTGELNLAKFCSGLATNACTFYPDNESTTPNHPKIMEPVTGSSRIREEEIRITHGPAPASVRSIRADRYG